MKIFLDDERPTPEGWVKCRWPSEVIKHLKSGNVEVVSLDHDLADKEDALLEQRQEITGYDVLLWLEEAVIMDGFIPPKIMIHSANPAGVHRMELAIKSINRKVFNGP